MTAEQQILEPRKIKATILVAQRAPLEVVELDMPEHLSFGQVKVKGCYSGICGAQINEMEGAKGPDKFLPPLLGHEGSGPVVAAGPGVKRVKPGDRVVMHWRQADGVQAEVPAYAWNGRKVNAGWVTTFNNYAIVSENRITPIPHDFDLRLVPFLGWAAPTAISDAH